MKKIVPFLFILLAASVYAAPAPYEIIINNATMECSTFWAGDEFLYCEMPEGWHVIGMEWETECPEGYDEILFDYICNPIDGSICCTEGSSGMGCNCENMVINDAEQKCAFVEDTNNCTLPEDWFAYVPGEESQEGLCPLEYAWVEVNCSVASNLTEEKTDKRLGDVYVNRNPDNTPYVVLILAIVAAIAAFIALKKK